MAVVTSRRMKVALLSGMLLLVVAAAVAYVYRKELTGTVNYYKSEQLTPFLKAGVGQLEVLDVNPFWEKMKDLPSEEPLKPSLGLFHGHHVVGRVVVSQEAELGMVKQAIRDIDHDGDHWGGSMAACFYPRHGIRLVRKDGANLDLLICYECARADIFRGDRKEGTVYLGYDVYKDHATPELLDKVLGKEVQPANEVLNNRRKPKR